MGVTFENGYGSKSVFNIFFKRMEGITPKSWLKSNQI